MSAPCGNLHLHHPHSVPVGEPLPFNTPRHCPGRSEHPDNANLRLCGTPGIPCDADAGSSLEHAANDQGASDGLAFLLRFAADRDDDARMHYFHASDGIGSECGCRYEGVGARPSARIGSRIGAGETVPIVEWDEEG